MAPGNPSSSGVFPPVENVEVVEVSSEGGKPPGEFVEVGEVSPVVVAVVIKLSAGRPQDCFGVKAD